VRTAAWVLLCLLAGSGYAAGAQTAASPAAASVAAGIVVTGLSGRPAVVTGEALARLPAVRVSISFQTEHGPRHGLFAGPLLWTVLAHAGAIDPSNPRLAVHEVVLVTGSDGYTAALGLGEIAPAFEGKQVILAEAMDGQPLGVGHLRIVVPGDRYGGRAVRDVVRIAVVEPAPPEH